MKYLDYDTYKILGGDIEEVEFNRLEYLSRKLIDSETHERIKYDFLEDVNFENIVYYEDLKQLMFELIRNSAQLNNINPIISSQSNEGMSISYTTVTTEELKLNQTELIRTYLQNIKDNKGQYLLFMGIE